MIGASRNGFRHNSTLYQKSCVSHTLCLMIMGSRSCARTTSILLSPTSELLLSAVPVIRDEADSAEYRTPSPNAETADPAESPNGPLIQRPKKPSWESVGAAEGREDSVLLKAEESPDWRGTDI